MYISSKHSLEYFFKKLFIQKELQNALNEFIKKNINLLLMSFNVLKKKKKN